MRNATKRRLERAEAKFLERKVDLQARAEQAALRLSALFRAGATVRPAFSPKGRAGSASYRPKSGPAYSLLIK